MRRRHIRQRLRRRSSEASRHSTGEQSARNNSQQSFLALNHRRESESMDSPCQNGGTTTTNSGNSGGVLQRTLQQRDQILHNSDGCGAPSGASKSDFPAELSPCTQAPRPDQVSQPASSGRTTVFPITTLPGGCYTHSPNTRAEQQHRCDGSVHALVADSSTPVVTISDSGTGHNVPIQSNCDPYLCQREDSRAHRPVHLAHQGASVVDSIPAGAVIPSWTTLSQIGTDERRTDSNAMEIARSDVKAAWSFASAFASLPHSRYLRSIQSVVCLERRRIFSSWCPWRARY